MEFPEGAHEGQLDHFKELLTPCLQNNQSAFPFPLYLKATWASELWYKEHFNLFRFPTSHPHLQSKDGNFYIKDLMGALN